MFTVTVMLLHRLASSGPSIHTLTVCVAVGVGVGDAVDVAVDVGVGVGQLTFTESPAHVVYTSTVWLSYTTCSPLKLKLALPQFIHDTLNPISASVPAPDMPPTPPALLMIRTVPCTPAGMNPQPLTGTSVPPNDPLYTASTCMMSGSYVTS
jgi:hypothetical protein